MVGHVRFGSLADICSAQGHVRFTPESDIKCDICYINDRSVVGTVGGTVIGTILLIIWKAFDVIFIGFIQAFIFMLLTVIYFGAAREGLEHEHH